MTAAALTPSAFIFSPVSSTICRIGIEIAAATSPATLRLEEHTSELQSLMRISYAVFCLKQQTKLRHELPHGRRAPAVALTEIFQQFMTTKTRLHNSLSQNRLCTRTSS